MNCSLFPRVIILYHEYTFWTCTTAHFGPGFSQGPSEHSRSSGILQGMFLSNGVYASTRGIYRYGEARNGRTNGMSTSSSVTGIVADFIFSAPEHAVTGLHTTRKHTITTMRYNWRST